MTKLFPNESSQQAGLFEPPALEQLSSSEASDLLMAWESIKLRLKESTDPNSFSTWIAPLDARADGPSSIIIELPNLVFLQGIHNEYVERIDQIKNQLGLDDLTVRFHVPEEESTPRLDPSEKPAFESILNSDQLFDQTTDLKDKNKVNKSNLNSMQVNDERGKAKPFSKSLSTEAQLNPNYTFDTFVKGDSNQFAVATCLSAAENPGKAYNPLFIYGSTGLGKTHLLHAVGNRVLQFNKSAVVTYISSERFMNEMIHCIRHNKQWDFRQKYRNCDVFLVDDIQFISGKKATQEEFFHTFNTLYAAKKQIVITSDLFPKDIPDIEDRLRNRFQWGLIADIQPPSIEHRIAILLSKADELGLRLGDEVAEYIAKHAKRNVRELEGALHRINAFAALQGEPITLDLAKRTFKDVLGEPPRRITIEAIQRTVAEHFKLRVSDLKSKRRQRAFAHPRQIAMFLSRKLTNASYPEIGDKFGGKDHTTVMHNVRKIEVNIDKDLDLKAHIEALERQLEQLQ